MVELISHWVDGALRPGSSGRVGAVFNPATGQQTAEESVAEAEAEITAIFDRWRGEGLIGGGA